MTDIFSELVSDFAVVQPQAIELKESQIEQALQWSQVATSEEQQWQLYLQGLALQNFEQWLQTRDSALSVQRIRGSLPSDVPFLPAVMLEVDHFRLCLLINGSLSDTQVTVPQAVVDLPAFTAHIYALVEVQEELDQSVVTACMRHDQLAQQIATLKPQLDWSYTVPRNWFNSSPDDLLLWLRCLAPEAIPLASTIESSSRQVDLEPLLSQLKTSKHLWQVLNWEQAAAVLQNSEQTNWLQRALQSRDFVMQASEAMENLASSLNPINTALWLQQTVENWTRAWVLVPSLALRSKTSEMEQPEEISVLISELQHQGVEIPATAAGAYRDLSLGSAQLRLSIVVWSSEAEWTLLLLLGPQPKTELSNTVRLQICDADKMLTDLTLSPENQETCLYSMVSGALDEQFWATLILEPPDPQTIMKLAPFRFEPPQS
ncbi:hypothetical protein C1752_01132 [Acaryochloris thomasi RCC1774]|uniref:DUF1822 family protein n=1 Tax=Acaryochloris thomasi RCC1774 TaxID=1764569 RepID=A0A2W1K226_9CYAN|nr:DUF1822 family protein [Acaryochloris thomasi]PZD74157.1 hypothetical protein C1752_01132 [Acaryochloris thomasi RCC1774]